MKAVRKIVDAGLLATIIDLPWKAKDMRVEIIVTPAADTEDESVAAAQGASLKGRLKEYANPALAEREHNAWAEHAAEKYGTL